MKKLPYLHKEFYRGKLVFNVRLRHGRRIRLRGEFGSPEFMEAYYAAVSGKNVSVPLEIPVTQTATLSFLLRKYRTSSEYLSLSEETRMTRDRYYRRMDEKSGTLPYASITRKNIVEGREKLKNTPASANDYVKACRALFKWAVESGHLEVDPAISVSKIKYETKGYSAWGQEDVDRFRAHWPIGTRERLALEFLVYTGLRRSDICLVGRQHIQNEFISMRLQKTKEEVFIPILPQLRAAMEAVPKDQLTFIGTLRGMPYTKESFGAWFNESAKEAGVNRSVHGLRKYRATQFAEAGATESELMAYFGWKNSQQVKTYIAKASKKKLSKNILARLIEDLDE